MKKILIISLLFLLTGCWNYKELNELAITTGVAIDKEDDQFLVTFLISNSKKSSSSQGQTQPSTAVYEGSGITIYDAMKDAASGVSKEIYLGHIDIVIISEEIAKKNTANVIDFLFRYPKSRNDFDIVMAQNVKAQDILKITTPLESFPSQNVSENLSITNELQGFTFNVTFNDFVKTLLEEGKDAILPSVTVIGDIEEGNKEENLQQNQVQTYLKLGNMALFKGDKFVSWSNDEESTGINILNNEIDTLGLITECEEGHIVTEVTSMKVEKEYIEDNKFKVSIKALGGIQELSCSIDLENVKNIEEIKNKNIEKIKEKIESALNLAKNNQTDIFGFGNLIYKKNPNHYKEIKDTFESEILTNIELEYDIDLNLDSKGKINNYIEVSDGNN